MKAESAQVASISDVHLGHHNTTAEEIIPNLHEAFKDTERNNALDVIIIAGDLFDRLMSLNNPQVFATMIWFGAFLRWAAARKVAVRLLAGTKSHDWDQNQFLMVLQEVMNVEGDVKYIDTLSIEYIDCIDRHVLWVPDDWRPDPDVTWMEVTQLLREKGLDKVDISVVHGSFEHQLPEVANAHPHKLRRYLDISRDYVIGGHIHIPGSLEHFICNGSFDRLTHGEEGPKGHWRLKLNRKSGNEAEFIENKNAKKYITVDCAGLPLEDAMNLIKSEVSRIPTTSFVRVRANEGDAILSLIDTLRKNYPTYTWSTKKDERKDTQRILLTDMRSTFQAVQLSPENIVELLMTRLSEKHTQDPAMLQLCRDHLIQELER
ncbi:metallophosphoesterase [Stenotrophomonas sp. GD03657]|uniref:metallophosphoesterase n=1 Tax=Stenotrophomonas sp. GD03657 TaxID=2975363 RepID=UPI00244BAE6A|nr:metallophosphoesterase [Stenotrophomonas sp. GD03657]MDH2154329.1 metallophosphoesterase [Stenotrophomonas sp. GD03657]